MRLGLLIPFLLTAAACAQTRSPADCHGLKKHGRYEDAKECYLQLTSARNRLHAAEGYWGAGRYKEANETFRALYSLQTKNPDLLVRWGLLLLAGSNPSDATRTVTEALEAKQDYPPALLALARVAAEAFSRQALVLAEKAYKLDPNLTEAKELLAVLALEEGDRENAEKHAREALSKEPEALEALTVLSALELLENKPAAEWQAKIAAINPNCAECEARLGRLFVLNRRYVEGIQHYENAVNILPEFWPAKSELGINLMRVGRDQEARKLLVECYENGFRNLSTANSLTLLDSYKNFEVIRHERFVLRLHKKEASLLRPYVEAEMERNLKHFDSRYGVKLGGPVTVEMYPDHEDFAVRTMGMPGLGALGVTFVLSVAMDSPSARKGGSFHWASTLRHELSHVYSLALTHHRIPRWFTEGVAVFEETSENPEWGDRITPDVIVALKDKKLLPIAKLDRGFIRPSYPQQVVVSYFQAGSICEWVDEKHGWPKLVAMMKSFGQGASTVDVIQEHLGMKPEQFDDQFLAWLDTKYGKTVQGFDDWTKGMKGLEVLLKAEKWKEAAAEARRLIDLYPDYVEDRSAYNALAAAELALNNRKAAIAALDAFAKKGGKTPADLKRLAELNLADGNKDAAIAALARVNYIQPVGDEKLHVELGRLLAEKQQWREAAIEYNALVASKPVDPASAHFNLARVLKSAGMMDQAREQVLYALEAAPGYREAQKLLLELESESPEKPGPKR